MKKIKEIIRKQKIKKRKRREAKQSFFFVNTYFLSPIMRCKPNDVAVIFNDPATGVSD